MNKSLSKYIISSMVALSLSALYAIIDGIFIGLKMADTGLAAINIAWPIGLLTLAIGVGIGSGGAIIMSNEKGRQNQKAVQVIFNTTILLLVISSIIITLILGVFLEPILQFLKVEGLLYSYVRQYLVVIIIGTIIQVLALGIVPILRNDRNPLLIMRFMVLGLVSNIVFDYLFIVRFEWEFYGVALATVLAQLIILSFAIVNALNKKYPLRFSFEFDFKYTKATILAGIAPFGIYLLPGIIIMINNFWCLAYGDEMLVTAYTVLCYIICPIQSLLIGVGEGMQPLVSYHHGANNQKEVAKLLKKSMITTFIIAVSLIIAANLVKNSLVHLFNASDEVAKIMNNALLLSSLGVIFLGFVKTLSAYFYAIKAHYIASAIIIFELILTFVCLLILPAIFDANGIWMTYSVVQGLLLIGAIVCYGYRKSK